MITIEPYYQGAEKELFEIFTTAITEICSKDYSPEQIRAWISGEYNHEQWGKKLENIQPYIATLGNKVVGYADIQSDGYIDHFFVHGSYQSKGIGSALMKTLLSSNPQVGRAYAHVSITARPFFEKKGFRLVKENIVTKQAVSLHNYTMERKS